MSDLAGTEAVAGRDPMLPELFTVKRIRRETSDTFTLHLDPGARGAFPFAPGQFDMLYAFGIGEAAISCSGDPARTDEVVHTIRAIGGVTRALQQVKRGDAVGVRGPFGSAWPVDLARGRDVVILAGGIGLAPLRPVIHAILADRGAYGRLFVLYGARTPDDVLYPKELERWRARGAVVEVTVDRASRDWKGHSGVVTKLIASAGFDASTAIAMICGPEVMMRFSARELERAGMTRDRIHVSMERAMRCGIGQCGHCQYGPGFVCKDGPVYRYDEIEWLLGLREI